MVLELTDDEIETKNLQKEMTMRNNKMLMQSKNLIQTSKRR